MAVAPEKVKISNLVVGISTVAALAGLLFGYDVGVISGAVLFLKKYFLLTAHQEGFIVGSVPFGALIASALCGKFNDVIGRRNNLLLTAVLFIVGTMGCVFAMNVPALVISRFIIGLGIGMGSFSAPLYIAEVSQREYRGAMVTLNQLAIVIGIMLAYCVDYLFTATSDWRYMFACGLLPAIVLFFLAWILPESPRWLMVHDDHRSAQAILTRIHGQENARKEFQELQEVVRIEKQNAGKKVQRGFFKVLLLGILVSILTQAVGINAIIYYAPSIFQQTGFDSATSAMLASIGVGVVNVVFTIVAIKLLDRYGRRLLLLIGVSGIVLSLLVMVLGFASHLSGHTALAWLMFFAIILFVACQAIGTGPACWLIPSEVFPVNMRGIGMGFSVAFNWGTNVLVAYFFPFILLNFGGTISFAIFLIIAIIALLYFFFFVPETKNVSLERIEENLYAGKKTRQLGA